MLAYDDFADRLVMMTGCQI